MKIISNYLERRERANSGSKKQMKQETGKEKQAQEESVRSLAAPTLTQRMAVLPVSCGTGEWEGERTRRKMRERSKFVDKGKR